MKNTRILWNNEEIELLVINTAERRINDPLPSLTSIFNEVQELVLPETRRRTILSITNQKDIVLKIRAKILELQNSNVEHIPVGVRVDSEVIASKLVKELTTPELINEMSSRFSSFLSMFNIKLNESAIKSIVETPMTRTVVVKSTTPDKIKVCIVGPHKDQFEFIQEKSKDLGFELIFLNKDHKTKMPMVDWIIIQSRFISHSKVAEFKSDAKLSGKIIELEPSAGITSICKVLADIKSKVGMGI